MLRKLSRLCLCLLAAGAFHSVASAQDWQAGAGDDWKKLLAAARQEGSVVVIGPPLLSKPLSDAFKRDTGLTVEFLGLVGPALVQRVVREVQSRNVTYDVAFTGPTVFHLQEHMVPLRPNLILPGVTEPKNWIDGKLKFADMADTYMLDIAHAVYGWPIVNPDLVKPDAIKSWNDLLKPEFKTKIAIHDPRVAGPGVGTSTFIANSLGLDYVKKLYVDQQPRFTREGRQLAEWVARGVVSVGIGSDDAEISEFEKAGIKTIKVLTDVEGGMLPMTGRYIPHVPKGSPHANAALVFMNWYASKPGQAVNGAYQVVWSRRTDVNLTELPERIRPRQGVAYLDAYGEDFVTQRRNTLLEGVRALLNK